MSMSKFAYLWREESSSNGSDASESDDLIKTAAADFYKSEQNHHGGSGGALEDSMEYLRDCDTSSASDLFTCFGHNTSFGTVGQQTEKLMSPSSELDSPIRQSNLELGFDDTTTTPSPSHSNNSNNHSWHHYLSLNPSTCSTNYESLVDTLNYVASQLADNSAEYPHVTIYPQGHKGSFGANGNNVTRLQNFGSVSSETLQNWMKLLRLIQDRLAATSDIDANKRLSAFELTCNLQKQVLQRMMATEVPKVCYAVPEQASKSQQQAQKYLRENPNFPMPETPFVWRGILPPRDYRDAVFSCKVFLGGLPYDMTEGGMMQAFKLFGNVKVEWPGMRENPLQHKGYAYVIFENEKQVKSMLQNCTRDYAQDGKWFCKMSSRRVRMKDVEVIPWALSDSNFALRPASKLEPHLTIFVGALHGMLNAEGLAVVMESLFGGVVHAGIDTDRNKYPIGSGRISFDNFRSYFAAITKGFVEIKSSKFSKTVQLDPYLEDSNCSQCSLQQAPYFCRSLSCFRYYCRTCFDLAHSPESLRTHRPLMRNPNKRPHNTGFSSPSFSAGNNNNNIGIGGIGSNSNSGEVGFFH